MRWFSMSPIIACSSPHMRRQSFLCSTLTPGKVIASLPCAENSDDMGYDPVRKRIYITGDGSTSVIAQQDADHYVSVAELTTGYRAKTSIFVPELNRLFMAVSSRGKRAGGKLVAPEPGPKSKSGSTKHNPNFVLDLVNVVENC